MPIRHVICATEAYLQQHGTPYTPQDLRSHSCISLGETPADARWKFRREGKTETVQTYGRYAANHTAVRLDAVRQHLGIGSLPLFTAREALANGDIVQVLPEWEFISSYSGDLWLLWAGDKHMPAEDAGDDRLSQRDGAGAERRQHRASEIIANHGMITPNTNQIPERPISCIRRQPTASKGSAINSSHSAAKDMTTKLRSP